MNAKIQILVSFYHLAISTPKIINILLNLYKFTEIY